MPLPAGFDFGTARQLVNVDLSAWSALLNGLVAFVSPCILPMLPIYGIYLLGEGPLAGRGKGAMRLILPRMLGFALGFVPLFILLGLGAGALGDALQKQREVFRYIGGALMAVFGLMLLDVIPGMHFFSIRADAKALAAGGFFKTMLLGVILAVSVLPCTSPFLFNVLLMAADAGSSAVRGMLLLLAYSLGLTVPFLLFMVLYTRLGGMLAFLRRNQVLIRKTAGAVMILLGVLRLLRVY